MSLIGALNLGSNALATQSTAVQVTGNNIANAGNATYSREVTNLSPAGEQQIQQGIFVGEGVQIDSIQRQINAALQGQLNSATSDNNAASTSQTYLGQAQSAINALGDTNLSTQLTNFFGSWSNLANNPEDTGLRQVVVQSGETAAQAFNSLSSQLSGIQGNATQQLTSDVTQANSLATQIASLNGQIVTAQGGTDGSANSLLDQRDAAVAKLSQLVNVSTTAQPDGSVNVYIGSQPLIQGTDDRGLTLTPNTSGTTAIPTINFTDDDATASVTSGEMGGLLSVQGQITGISSQLDTQANSLIFELNKLHASGQGTQGFTSVTSTNSVADPTVALDSPQSGLTNVPDNGSFVVHVTDTATGLSTSTLVKVSLTGDPATDTTLNGLQTELAGINGVNATVADGKLTISAATPGQQISFSQDSSGTLATLGINTFFTGSSASTIAVNSTVENNPALVAAAQNGDPGDNQTATAIANLDTTPVASLGGSTLTDAYQSMVTGVANTVANATTDTTSSAAVVQTLTTQQQSISGVSLDTETVNLIQQQNAYSAAARLITTVNDMLTTLMDITTS
jgi:flagellar hook-associated protein 1 FlgK